MSPNTDHSKNSHYCDVTTIASEAQRGDESGSTQAQTAMVVQAPASATAFSTNQPVQPCDEAHTLHPVQDTTTGGQHNPCNDNNDNGNQNSAATVATIAKKEEEKAGLSLLFAASLLQSSRNDDSFGTGTIPSNTTTVPPPKGDSNGAVNSNCLPTQPTAAIIAPVTATTDISATLQQNQDKELCATVTTPRQMDVCCGRGGGVNSHPGNVMYRRVVEYNKPIYRHVPKRHRMLVSQSIVVSISNEGGRFLQQKRGSKTSSSGKNAIVVWEEIPFRRAVQKTSQALRERPEQDNGQVPSALPAFLQSSSSSSSSTVSASTMSSGASMEHATGSLGDAVVTPSSAANVNPIHHPSPYHSPDAPHTNTTPTQANRNIHGTTTTTLTTVN